MCNYYIQRILYYTIRYYNMPVLYSTVQYSTTLYYTMLHLPIIATPTRLDGDFAYPPSAVTSGNIMFFRTEERTRILIAGQACVTNALNQKAVAAVV